MANIASIILILASLGLFFGYIDPNYTGIQDLQAKKIDYDKALDSAAQLAQERDKLLAKLNSFKTEDLNRLTKLLPDNIDSVRLIIDIDGIASGFGMRIRNFKVETAKEQSLVGSDAETYGTLSMTFSTTGTYETFTSFIRSLESSLRIIDVQAISFSSSENQLDDYSVTIKTYWLK
jgi:Tfp pilus assembly protein PilO